MFGCAEGHVIYGWREDDEDTVIDMDADHPFELYYDEQVKGFGCTPIYGIEYELDKTSGLNLDEKSKKRMRKAFRRYKRFKKSEGTEVKSEVGFHLGISGDMENCGSEYTLPPPEE